MLKEAETLLESISNEIKKIPSILDRSDRLEHVAKTWGIWGEKRQSEFFYSQIIDLLNELSPWNQDKKLEHIVQAAYQISPDFADNIVERLDSRFPDKVLKPFQIKLKSLSYAHDIEKLISESENNWSRLQGLIIKSSVKKRLNDLLNQNGTLPPKEKILEIIYRSSFYDSDIVNDVLKWALECENQQQRCYKN